MLQLLGCVIFIFVAFHPLVWERHRPDQHSSTFKLPFRHDTTLGSSVLARAKFSPARNFFFETVTYCRRTTCRIGKSNATCKQAVCVSPVFSKLWLTDSKQQAVFGFDSSHSARARGQTLTPTQATFSRRDTRRGRLFDRRNMSNPSSLATPITPITRSSRTSLTFFAKPGTFDACNRHWCAIFFSGHSQ